MTQRIQRRRTPGWRMPPGVRYVGRGSRWGNPWSLERNPDRAGDQWFALYDTPIGPWDGPFPTKRAATEAAVRLYAESLRSGGLCQPEDFPAWIGPLVGRDLACWCPLVGDDGEPWPCHADILLTLVAEVTGRADT